MKPYGPKKAQFYSNHGGVLSKIPVFRHQHQKGGRRTFSLLFKVGVGFTYPDLGNRHELF
tara:strand:+ start:24421 stop:24600 length:180 start_codon:yes stop_codon:yes gene_type:complete